MPERPVREAARQPLEPREALDPREAEALVRGYRRLSDDEMELIEMRYRQLRARMELEEVFSETQMRSS
jgi:phosphopantetheine adenylyltransferase